MGLSNGLQSVLWEKRTMGVGGDEGEPFMYLRAKWEGNAAALSSRVSQRPRRTHIVLSEEKKKLLGMIFRSCALFIYRFAVPSWRE